MTDFIDETVTTPSEDQHSVLTILNHLSHVVQPSTANKPKLDKKPDKSPTNDKHTAQSSTVSHQKSIAETIKLYFKIS